MQNDGAPSKLSRRTLLRRGLMLGLGATGVGALAVACSTSRQNVGTTPVNPVTPVTDRPGWVVNAGTPRPGTPFASPTR